MSTPFIPDAESEMPNALAAGTRLGEYEILGVIGVGGFGIVYRALDHALEREVAIKEYLPASLAGRNVKHLVSLLSQSYADTFALGLRSFVNEARLLAKFDHPSLVKVHRFWEGQGTAYMVMPLYVGRTLREVRQAFAQAPDEAWLRELLLPVLGALDVLHKAEVYHRDIAPDNILIAPDGQPVLLDFGAARRVIGDRSQNLTAILKPRYAPIEQYAESTSLRQGAWTDLYALGATLHYLVTGAPPAPSTTRIADDDQIALAATPRPGISTGFLDLIDWMLAPRPQHRPQSVAQLRAVLDGQAAIPDRATTIGPRPPTGPDAQVRSEAADPDATQIKPRSKSGVGESTSLGDGHGTRPHEPTQVQRREAAAPVRDAKPLTTSGGAAAAASVPGRGSRLPLLLGTGLVVVVIAAGAWIAGLIGSAKPAPGEPGAGSAVTANSNSPPPLADPAVAPVPMSASAVQVTDPASASTATPLAVALPSLPAQATSAVPGAGARTASRAAGPRAVPNSALNRVTAQPSHNGAAAETQIPAAPPPTAAILASPAAAPTIAPAGPADPNSVCGKRILLAYHRCMLRECEKPEFAGHPECARIKAIEDRQKSGSNQ
jgi:serine/threonine protein kinase